MINVSIVQFLDSGYYGSVLNSGSIFWFDPLMWCILGAFGSWLLESFECLVGVVWHGDVHILARLITIQIQSAIFCTCFVNSYFVFIFNVVLKWSASVAVNNYIPKSSTARADVVGGAVCFHSHEVCLM